MTESLRQQIRDNGRFSAGLSAPESISFGTTGLCLLLALAIMTGRLLLLDLYPLTDTTEARYAEVSRLMVDSGDWTTPYFEPDVPFWGKPPLAFWAQAVSIRLLGLTEFAVRLPSWLISVASLGLLWFFPIGTNARRSKALAILILASSAQFLLLSGAVLTDPFLAFAVLLGLVAFAQVMAGNSRRWGYLFFVALGIGGLAKGPLVLVLVGAPIALWLTLCRRWRDAYGRFPIASGTLLTLGITVPWYWLAERSTPGFLSYFLVGEHILRFLDPGWQGDLYGSAHEHAKGTIWLYFIAATLPWGLISLLSLAWRRARCRRATTRITRSPADREYMWLLALFALFPPAFFSLSSNILHTYVLPSLAPLALLIASSLVGPSAGVQSVWQARPDSDDTASPSRSVFLTAMIAPSLLFLIVIHYAISPERLKSEKELVAQFQAARASAVQEQLIVVEKATFSARYYSKGAIELITTQELSERLENCSAQGQLVAIPKKIHRILGLQRHQTEILFASRKYLLTRIQSRKDCKET